MTIISIISYLNRNYKTRVSYVSLSFKYNIKYLYLVAYIKYPMFVKIFH